MGSKTGAAVVHAPKMPTQYILARESMHVQCAGTIADVKMLPAFTSKRSLGCFTDVLRDVLEGNPDLQLVVVRPSGEDLEHQFEYTAATVDGEGRQETVYLENLDDRCLDLRADAPQGASRKNTSWQGFTGDAPTWRTKGGVAFGHPQRTFAPCQAITWDCSSCSSKTPCS